MLLTQFVLTKKGDSNGLLTILTPEFGMEEPRESRYEKARDAILVQLRGDPEARMHGKGIPESNPSKDISTVQFFYLSLMQKKTFYQNRTFPIDLRNGTYIEDVFVCQGSRFNLQPSQVLVEVYSNGEDDFWAMIHYVADMKVPACIIEARKASLFVSDKWIASRLEEEAELQRHLTEQVERFERQDAEAIAATE